MLTVHCKEDEYLFLTRSLHVHWMFAALRCHQETYSPAKRIIEFYEQRIQWQEDSRVQLLGYIYTYQDTRRNAEKAIQSLSTQKERDHAYTLPRWRQIVSWRDKLRAQIKQHCERFHCEWVDVTP